MLTSQQCDKGGSFETSIPHAKVVTDSASVVPSEKYEPTTANLSFADTSQNSTSFDHTVMKCEVGKCELYSKTIITLIVIMLDKIIWFTTLDAPISYDMLRKI